MSDPAVTPPPVRPPRVVLGGFLMGLANLVPGVSGGTMILAMGLYDRFIGSVAAVTRFRFAREPVLFLGFIALGLAFSVLGLAGPAVWLVTEHRWIAYSLFVGMTLGGVPALLKQLRGGGAGGVVGTLVGFAAMVGLAFFLAGTPLPQTSIVFLLAGAAAAASMILPGISGSYLLLVFGLYDVVIGSVRPRELLAAPLEAAGILAPVGVGAVLGIAVLSNVLKTVLVRFPATSHGVLLGLLLGSVAGLWPFQEAVHPDLVSRPGIEATLELTAGEDPALVAANYPALEWSVEHARAVEERYRGLTKGELKLHGLELTYVRPDAHRIGIALACLLGGVAITLLLGREPRSVRSQAPSHHLSAADR
ncbi:MAG: DUF368 domain-containing protein [Planctomycetota bacterium]